MAAAGAPGPTCVLGIDLGTTSVKAALVTGTERGLALAQSCSRETQAHSDSPGAAAQVRAQLSRNFPQGVLRDIAGRRPCLAELGLFGTLRRAQWLSWIGLVPRLAACVWVSKSRIKTPPAHGSR